MVKKGFTLIELLVVMAILGILSTLAFDNYRVSQMKSRDAKKKADLGQIQRSLEMYHNDKSNYPATNLLDFTQGNSGLIDAKGTVYMKELPCDPSGNPEYCYRNTGNGYQIYARLENGQDPGISGPYSCGGASYNYGVASSNESP